MESEPDPIRLSIQDAIGRVRSHPPIDGRAVSTDGPLLLLLVNSPASWIRRRVESVEFVGASTIRRQVSVDFDMAGHLFPIVPTRLSGGTRPALAVPLARLEKQPLTAFDVRDESGQPVPILTSEENGEMTWSMLLTAAEAVVGLPPPPLVARDLHYLTYAGAKDCKLASSWALSGLSHNNYRASLRGDEWFRPLAEEYSSDFTLLAVLADEPARPRRILKYSYDEKFKQSDLTIPMRLGWEAVRIELEVPLVGHAASYHFEFEIPDGLRIIGGELVATTADPEDPRQARRSATEAGMSSRIHLYMTGVNRYASGKVTVDICPQRDGLVRWGFFVSAGIAAVLWACALFTGTVRHAEADSAVALLLAAPGVMATLIVRPGEHALASNLLRPVRGVVLAAGLSSFGAAAVVACHLPTRSMRWWMVGLAVVASFAAGMLRRTWRACGTSSAGSS